MPGPEFLEDGVRKTEHENVLDGFFPEVVVDAKHLLLVSVPRQLLVQFHRGSKIMPEWFFDNQPLPEAVALPPQQVGIVQMFYHVGELTGRGSKVKEKVVRQTRILECDKKALQPFIPTFIREIANAIKEVFGKFLPDLLIDRLRSGKLIE